MNTNALNNEERSKEYLKDCFMQKCQDELDEFSKDSETTLDKYSKLAIKFMPLISIGVSSSVILLNSPLEFKVAANIIALSVLVFFIATILIARYYINNKDDKNIMLDIYDSWSQSVLAAIVINIGLYFAGLGSYVLVILGFATIAMLVIQNGKRSL